MSQDALVSVRRAAGHTEVYQRLAPYSSTSFFAADLDVRRTPALFGLGLLEATVRRAPNGFVRPIFGALAEHDSLYNVVSRAFAVELGISSTTHCARTAPSGSYPKNCVPVISNEEVNDVVAFIRYLAAPPSSKRIRMEQGRNAFAAAQCTSCHWEHLETRLDAPPPLGGRRIAAYTDLQLHDLGQGPVRTTALWGLNSFGPPYMHHGRAKSLEQAIEQHHGDGRWTRDLYRSLSADDRNALIRFLKSL